MTTECVERIIDDPDFIIVEVDLDPAEFAEAHLPGAVLIDWNKRLRRRVSKKVVSPQRFAKILTQVGVTPNHKIVLYGDNNNWCACWMFWMLKMAGHQHVWIMDGGKRKWMSEGRPVSNMNSRPPKGQYVLNNFDLRTKASFEDVFHAMFRPGKSFILDVRSEKEYQGVRAGPAGSKANVSQAGHVPTAVNVPWNLNTNIDGTFKHPDELKPLYTEAMVGHDKAVITYCAIGERASLTWFVLKHLVGVENVALYDRSMAEWSARDGAPVIGKEAA